MLDRALVVPVIDQPVELARFLRTRKLTVKARGVWELSTPRLEDLRGALQRAGDATCTETASTLFNAAATFKLCGGLGYGEISRPAPGT